MLIWHCWLWDWHKIFLHISDDTELCYKGVTSYENIILNTTHKQHNLCRKTIHLLKHNTCQYIKFLFHIPRPLVTGEKLSKLNEKKVKMPIYHDKKQYLTVMHEDIMEYTSIQKTSRLICMIYFFK